MTTIRNAGLAALLAGTSSLFATAAHAQQLASEPSIDVSAAAVASAATQPAAPLKSDSKRNSRFDPVWKALTLHKDSDSEFRLVGRIHVDNYVVDANRGDESDLVVRRARIGAKGRLFGNLQAQLETEVDLEGGPLYSRLTDAYLAWKFSNAARVAVGKQSVKFTLDGATSSNELLTIDRSNVANNFWFTDEYIPGVSLSGKSGKWVYNSGVFSGGRKNRDFGEFNAGQFLLGSLGRDFGEALGVKRALVRADYVYNERDSASNFTRPFGNIGSLALILDAGRFGFSGDIVAGDGSGSQSDAFGATATPWFNLTDSLQLVGRYTFVKSERANGVRLGRYENVVTRGRGDRYDEMYAGLNYYIYGHKLKLQTGLTYADMRDRAGDGGAHEGWTWTTALRVSW